MLIRGPWKNILIATAADSGPAVAAPAGFAEAAVVAADAVAAGVAAVVADPGASVADPAVSAAVLEAAVVALGVFAAVGAARPQSAGVDLVAVDSGSIFP